MGFLFYVQVFAAIATTALTGAFMLGFGCALITSRFYPSMESEPRGGMIVMFAAIGLFGGTWLCIARLI